MSGIPRLRHCFSEMFQEHPRRLLALLQAIRSAGLTMKPEKFHLGFEELLGVSRQGFQRFVRRSLVYCQFLTHSFAVDAPYERRRCFRMGAKNKQRLMISDCQRFLRDQNIRKKLSITVLPQ